MPTEEEKRQELIKCITRYFKAENDYLRRCASELKNYGIVVIDLNLIKKESDFLRKTDWFSEIKKFQLRDFKTDNPQHGFVLGAFGALGNPSSFHNLVMYQLRYILFKKLSRVFGYMDNKRYLESLFDRVAIRREGTSISGESFHRDTCSVQKDSDHIYGGWINLDDSGSQYFSCVPGTHTCAGRGGFEKISGDYPNKVKIEIKPKQVIIFNQNIIHEINKQKFTRNSVRLYLGWRHTNESEPLFNSKTNPQFNITQILQRQLVPPLPSGDLAVMYSKNHPGLWKSRMEILSSEIKDYYLETDPKKTQRYKDGKVVKRALKEPIQLVQIPDYLKTIYYPNKTFYN